MTIVALALALTLSAIGEVRADPIITPLLTAILGPTLFGTTIIGSLTVGGLLSGLVSIGLSFGLALLAAGLKKTPAPENGVLAVQQPTPYRAFAYGPTRYAGAFALREEQAGVLYQCQALFGHPIAEFTGLYLNDDLVTVPISSFKLNGAVAEGADGRYKNSNITIDSRLGAVPETAYSLILSNLPSIWPSTNRGDGVASVFSYCRGVKSDEFSKVYPNYAPAVSPIMKTALVFDPRDETQEEDDPSTWKYSDNVALAILNFQCHSLYGYRKSYARAIAPVLEDWITAIDACDDTVAKKTGSEKRYRLGGWLTTEQDRSTALKTMLACCDGWLLERGDGAVQLSVGKYEAPTVTITDADIIAWTVQRGQASIDTINQVSARYNSPDNGYSSVESTPLKNTADQAKRVGPPRGAILDLPWVQSTGQASRLLKRELIRHSQPTRGKLTLNLSGINAAYARWIQVDSNSIPRLNGVVIENRRPVISLEKLTATIEFIVSGPGIDAYDPATEESAEPMVAGRPTTVGLPIPANVTVVAEQVDTGGAPSVYLVVSWDEPSRTDLDYRVAWREADVGSGAGNWAEQTFSRPTIAASRVTVTVAGVTPGVLLDVQVFTVASGKTLSTGSVIEQVDTTPTATAPAAPTSVSATGGPGYADLSCVNPSSSNFAAIQWYRAASIDPFGSAVAVGAPIFGFPSATTTYRDSSPAAGSFRYWAVAISSASVASSPGGPATTTVSAPSNARFDFINNTQSGGSYAFSRSSTGSYFDSAGVLQSAATNVIRIDHDATPAKLGLLVETSSTNSLRNGSGAGASAGTPGTAPTNWTLGASSNGVQRSIVGTGTEDGLPYVDIRFAGTASPAAAFYINTDSLTQIVAAAGQTWTSSMHLRLVAGTLTATMTLSCSGRTVAGADAVDEGATAVTVTTAALKTQRKFVARAFTGGTVARVLQYLAVNIANGATVDFTLRIGLPQLEQRTTISTLIPTTSAAVTRAADVLTITPTNAAPLNWHAKYDDNSTSSISTGHTGALVVDPATLTRPRVKEIWAEE